MPPKTQKRPKKILAPNNEGQTDNPVTTRPRNVRQIINEPTLRLNNQEMINEPIARKEQQNLRNFRQIIDEPIIAPRIVRRIINEPTLRLNDQDINEQNARIEDRNRLTKSLRRVKDNARSLADKYPKRRIFTYNKPSPPLNLEYPLELKYKPSIIQVEKVTNELFSNMIENELRVIFGNQQTIDAIRKRVLTMEYKQQIKFLTFLAYCRYVGVRNSGVNNPTETVTTDILIEKINAKVIPDEFKEFVKNEFNIKINYILYPSMSKKSKSTMIPNLFSRDTPVDLGDLYLPNVGVNMIEQGGDTIQSLDLSILSPTVSVGRTFVHTKSYIDVRDHINNLMNPVNEIKDLSELLQKMQPKKGKPNDIVVRNPIMNYLKLKKSTLDKNQSRLMISPPLIDDDFKEEEEEEAEEAEESDDDFIDDKEIVQTEESDDDDSTGRDQTEESDDVSTDRDGFAAPSKGESDVESNILCDKCGKNSFGSSYNSVKYVDGKTVSVNCCSSKCFAKIKF